MAAGLTAGGAGVLTNKQAKFLEALLKDPKRNATAAALAAGSSQASAKKQGSRWRYLPAVQAALAANSAPTGMSTAMSTEMSTVGNKKMSPESRPLIGVCQLVGVEETEKHAREVGRPTSYCTEIAEEICYQLATSPKSLKALCEEEGRFPSHRTVMRWLAANEEFCHLYVVAREQQGEYLAFEALEIADDGSLDIGFRQDGKGNVQQFVDRENIARSKLRVDHRRWLASKLAPRKYGEKLELSAGTARTGNPLAEVLREIQADDTPTIALSKRYKVIEVKPEDSTSQA